MDHAAAWTVGAELPRIRRTMTAERMRWYADAYESVIAFATEPMHHAPNIHTDDEFARSKGLPARVADGMITTNWVSSLLSDIYGVHYLEGGSLRTRYVKPVFVDDVLEIVVTIVDREPHPSGGDQLRLEVACTKPNGDVATAGTATVRVPAGA
ncbi:MAG: MaoC family dehydratase [Acidimicrobiia bacterium]